MAAGDMAELVREHALHLAGVVGGIDQTRLDVDPLPACNKGVERRIVDQHDLDRARTQACGFGQRIDQVLQQRFGLGVAQDALRSGRLRSEGNGREAGDHAGEKTHRPSC